MPTNITPDPIGAYGATWHRRNNTTGPQGGSINNKRKITTGPVPTQGPIVFTSSDPLDSSQVYLVEGMSSKRLVVSETVMIAGSALMSTENSFNRLYSITKQSGSALLGDLTVFSGNSIIGIMEAGPTSETGSETTELLNLLTSAVGRANDDSIFYEKLFLRNNSDGIIARLEISEYQSDFKERVFFGPDSSFDDNTTSVNRITKPAVLPQDPTDVGLVFTNVPIGASVGIWLRLVIPAGEGAVLNGWKVRAVADGTIQILDLLHREISGTAGSRIFSERDLHPIGGGNPLRYIELKGGKFVQQQFYQPDPVTFRDQFYYNTRLNKLFKKINTKPRPVWKLVR